MKLVVAGGGTGGHVLPVVAVLDEFEQRNIPLDLLWIGSETGHERSVASERGIPYRPIQTGKLRRYGSLQTIPDTIRIPAGTLQAAVILRSFKPDLVFSSGGFVSVPSVVAAWLNRLPVLTHEQTASLGLANQINARFSTMMAFSFARSLDRGNTSKRTILTGNPVRTSLLAGNAERAYETLQFDPDVPLIYVTGGARGASPLNELIEATLPSLLERYQIVHQTGPEIANDDFTRLSRVRDQLPEASKARYRVFDYVNEELRDVYAASTLVVSRAGAGSVSELAMLRKASILIPLQRRGEQWMNARVLGDVGAALIIDKDEVTPARLEQEIDHLMLDPQRIQAMGNAAGSVATPDAASNLADALLELANQAKGR